MLAEPAEGLLERVAEGEGSFGTYEVRYLDSLHLLFPYFHLDLFVGPKTLDAHFLSSCITWEK